MICELIKRKFDDKTMQNRFFIETSLKKSILTKRQKKNVKWLFSLGFAM